METKLRVQSKSLLRVGAVAGLSTLMLPWQAAHAQEDGSTGRLGLEETVVTAQRREQNAQDVPITINAFSADTLEALRIDDIESLAAHIPGFSVSTLSKSRFNPSLRGGSSSLVSAGAEQAVGLFIDDQYFGGAGDFELELFDVERIEVLRGPQGTLFGRNTTGGSINVVTRKPTRDLEGKVEATLGNYDTLDAGGYISGPVAGDVYGSLAFSSRESDGTSKNITTGNDIENTNRSSFRGKLLWEVSPEFEVTATLGYSRADESAAARDAIFVDVPVTNTDLVDINFIPDNDPRTVQQYTDGEYKSHQWTGNLRLDYEVENASLLSITTYRDFDSEDVGNSISGTPVPIAGFGEPRTVEAFSQEFRYVSAYDGSFNWAGGLYYYYSDETRFVKNNYTWNHQTAGGLVQALTFCPVQVDEFWVSPDCITDYPELFETTDSYVDERNKTTSYSVFFDGSYELFDGLALLAGGRYTIDEKKFDADVGGDPEFFFNSPTTGEIDPATGLLEVGQTVSAKEDWSEFTYRLGLQYDFSDSVMAYGMMSTGFRSGLFDGAQSDPSLVGVPLDPETAISYELGVKSRFLDDRMQLNVTVFQVDYEDLQFYVTAGAEAISTNAAEASVEGVEVDFIADINSYLRFSANYSYQDGDSSGIPAEAEIADGTPPQGTIPNSWTAALDFAYPLENGDKFSAFLSYVHKDEYGLEFNDAPQFNSETDALINASMTYAFSSGFEVSIWGQNLNDEDIVIYGNDFSATIYDALTIFVTNPEVAAGSSQPRYAAPRTYGATFRYLF